MKKLCGFALNERAQAGLLKELLEREGINCLLRNDQLSSALGEIPFLECLPELWVVDDDVYPRAKQLLENWLSGEGEIAEQWTCAHCGEEHDGQFGSCWKCGTDRET